MILDHGANVNVQGGQVRTALVAAYAGTAKDIVQLLIEAEADMEAHSANYGNTLKTASRYDDEDPSGSCLLKTLVSRPREEPLAQLYIRHASLVKWM